MKEKFFTGLKVCACGKAPVFGAHRLHEHNGKTGLPGIGHHCTTCGEAQSVIGGGADFSAKHWNGKRPDRKLDAPGDDWYWGELYCNAVYMGGTDMYLHKFFVPFRTKRNPICAPCCYGEDNYLHDLAFLINGIVVEMPFPKFKRTWGVTAVAHESHCTDGTKWPVIQIRTMSIKYRVALCNAFGIKFQ